MSQGLSTGNRFYAGKAQACLSGWILNKEQSSLSCVLFTGIQDSDSSITADGLLGEETARLQTSKLGYIKPYFKKDGRTWLYKSSKPGKYQQENMVVWDHRITGVSKPVNSTPPFKEDFYDLNSDCPISKRTRSDSMLAMSPMKNVPKGSAAILDVLNESPECVKPRTPPSIMAPYLRDQSNIPTKKPQ